MDDNSKRIPDSGPNRGKSGRGGNSVRRQNGRLGEEAACAYLLRLGYVIVGRNWRCRSGEIDIIAEHEGRLVFVEVRSRRYQMNSFGTAAESVDWRKQRQVRATAQMYLRQSGKGEAAIRFDVIAVSLAANDEDGIMAECRHYEGAF